MRELFSFLTIILLRALAEILDTDNDTFEGIMDAFARNAQSIFGYLFDDQPS